MSNTPRNMHSEASLNRRLVLFATQLEGYLAHFPHCHKYTITQGIRQAFLDVWNLTVEAQKRYHKKTTLGQLETQLVADRARDPKLTVAIKGDARAQYAAVVGDIDLCNALAIDMALVTSRIGS